MSVIYIKINNMNQTEYNELLCLQEYKDFNLEQGNVECCVCLKNIKAFKDGFRMPCCKNFIHPWCFIEHVIRVTMSCPLCRCELRCIISKLNIIDSCLIRCFARLLIDIEEIEMIYIREHSLEDAIKYTRNILKVIDVMDKFYNSFAIEFQTNYLSQFTFYNKACEHFRSSMIC